MMRQRWEKLKTYEIRDWQVRLSTSGTAFGYFQNASKTWLVIKNQHHAAAVSIFAGTGANMTLKADLISVQPWGAREYVTSHVESKVNEWISSIQCLASIWVTQPHATFSALTHGLMTTWTYFSLIIADIDPLMTTLDDALRSDLIPALTGRPPPSDLQCILFAVPVRLGIDIPSKTPIVSYAYLYSSLPLFAITFSLNTKLRL